MDGVADTGVRQGWWGRPTAVSVLSVELKVSTQYQGGRAIITAAGEVDLYTAPRLQATFAELLRDGAYHIVVDLGGVEFCDSTGMNVLLSALKRTRERNGSVSLVDPQPPVRKILRVTGLDTVFAVYEGIDEALADLAAVDR